MCLKILLLEYITAGGFNRMSLDTALLQEAMLMRDALMRDFSQLPDVEIVTSYDARLAPPCGIKQAMKIDTTVEPEHAWQSLLNVCDSALVVAPESAGMLSRLTLMIEKAKVQNLGSPAHAVDLTGDKYQTYQLLSAANIHTVATYKASEIEQVPVSETGYIIKPNDGAGCEGMHFFNDMHSLRNWLKEYNNDNLIIQPYQPGIAASISALFKSGLAWVLSANTQLIASLQPQAPVKLKACAVNALPAYIPHFNVLAKQIAQLLPSLNGYAGIDVIIDNDRIYVVEINPRITSSYIGLKESLNHNPAQLIIDAVCQPDFGLPPDLTRKEVEVQLNE